MADSSRTSDSDLTHSIVIDTELISCPLCDDSDYHVVVEAEDPQWGIPGTFQVVVCTSCQHRFMNPAPTASSLSDCYPTNYGPHQNQPAIDPHGVESSETGDSAVNDTDSNRPWYLKWLPLKKIPGFRRLFYWLLDDRSQVFPAVVRTDVKEIQSELEGAQSDAARQAVAFRAFELGCAAGAYLQKLEASGWDVQGLEPGIDAAHKAVQAGLKVDQGTLGDHSYPEDAYQWIALWMVLEHVPDPRATLEELFRMLASNGTLALSVPNAGCWEPFVFGRHWDAWDLPRHLHHFRPSTLRRLLAECGYTDVRIQHQRTLLNVVGSVGVWLTSFMPNSRMAAWFRNYPHQPRLWFQLITAPIAHLLAAIGQGGRLTVTATKVGNQSESDSRIHGQSNSVSPTQVHS